MIVAPKGIVASPDRIDRTSTRNHAISSRIVVTPSEINLIATGNDATSDQINLIAKGNYPIATPIDAPSTNNALTSTSITLDRPLINAILRAMNEDSISIPAPIATLDRPSQT